MGDPERLTIRAVRQHEWGTAGAVVAQAYATLGDPADPGYERKLRDVAGRGAASEVLVALSGDDVVGCVTFVAGDEPLSQLDDPEAATFRMLGVASGARGRGVGEALVRACIERAQGAGYRRVGVHTRTSMTGAQRLYERLGFRRAPDHDFSPAPGVDLLGYVLDLG